MVLLHWIWAVQNVSCRCRDILDFSNIGVGAAEASTIPKEEPENNSEKNQRANDSTSHGTSTDASTRRRRGRLLGLAFVERALIASL